MSLLHLVEWRTVSAMAVRPRSESKPAAQVCGLRRAIALESLYYVLILPYVYANFHTLLGRHLAVAAIYHWGGLALSESPSLFDKWAAGAAAASKGSTLIAKSAVAVLDIARWRCSVGCCGYLSLP